MRSCRAASLQRRAAREHFRFQTRKAMKVLVCGGRNFRSPAQVFRALDRLHQEKPITELMQGGATGAGPIQAAPWVWRTNWESNPVACASIGPLPGRFDTVEKRP